jgi:tetratricopeptide (TPR) repeat protein
MGSRKKSILFIAFLAMCALLPACQRRSTPAGTSSDLQHFDGFIDNSKHTNDRALSDLYVRASRALESGDAKAAEALYRQAISKYPKDPDGYESLGACLYLQGRYEEAKAEYSRALELKPNSEGALYGLGCVAHKEKRYSEAVGYLEKALQLNKDYGMCHRVLGLVYDETGDRAKAVFHYQRAIELDPTNAGDESVRVRLKALRQ